MEWRAIPSCPGYEVSDAGRVRRAVDGHEMCLRDNGSGYLKTSVTTKGRRRTLKVHVAVAEAFLGRCPQGMEVAHINGKRADNRRWNLMHATRAQNNAHRRA